MLSLLLVCLVEEESDSFGESSRRKIFFALSFIIEVLEILMPTPLSSRRRV